MLSKDKYAEMLVTGVKKRNARMKLLPPEPDIELYEDGFDGKDILGRGDSGKQLSDLIERIEDPIVIALDGSWEAARVSS